MESLIWSSLWNVVLLSALLALQPFVRIFKLNAQYALSNFDERVDEGVFARRLAMVRNNQIEALVLWLPVVLFASVFANNISHPHVSWIASAFLISRFAYAVVSLAGVPVVRSIAWFVGFAAWGYLTWIVLGALGA